MSPAQPPETPEGRPDETDASSDVVVSVSDHEFAKAHRIVADRLEATRDLTHAAQAEWHRARADELEPPHAITPNYIDGLYRDRHGLLVERKDGSWSRCGSANFNDATAHTYYAPLQRLQVASPERGEIVIQVADILDTTVRREHLRLGQRQGAAGLHPAIVLYARIAQAAAEQLEWDGGGNP